jgi:hypothetical protein
MVFDIQHKIRYRIKFIKPVDLFDVIYKLKIQTRNDFKGCENYIDLIEIDPINDVFFVYHRPCTGNKWRDSSDDWNEAGNDDSFTTVFFIIRFCFFDMFFFEKEYFLFTCMTPK